MQYKRPRAFDYKESLFEFIDDEDQEDKANDAENMLTF